MRRTTSASRASRRNRYRSASRGRGNVTRSATPIPRLFGTDGVRGVAGEYPLDHPTVRRLGAALVRAWRAENAGAPGPRILIGRDTRESGSWIEAELSHGASGEGAVAASAGVVPTPAVAYRSEERRVGKECRSRWSPY